MKTGHLLRQSRLPARAQQVRARALCPALCTLRAALGTLLCALGLLIAGSALAGNQKEEAMADAVRLALANAIADARPPKPQFGNIQQRIHYLYWRGEMSERLKKRLPDAALRIEFLETLWYEASRAGLDPAMVMGLIQVESAWRKYAVSVAGARGYMQVMPFWTNAIGDRDRTKLFHMQTNLRYGCAILRLYLDMEHGDYYMALGRYNGSRGKPEYPNAVRSAWRNWEFGSVQAAAADLHANTGPNNTNKSATASIGNKPGAP